MPLNRNENMKKIIITGATSFIGSTLAQAAIEKGIEVLAICRRDSRNKKNLNSSTLLKIMECNLEDLHTIDMADKYDEFYHLAWGKTSVLERDDAYSQSDNIRYTLDAVKLAKRSGCTVFVGTGSQAEYGNSALALNEQTPVFPTSGYGIAKLAAGQLSRLLCRQLEIKHSWARILSVYGEKDADTTLIKYCIHTMLRGESPKLTKCEQLWDYMYCDDTANALLAIGEKGIDGRVYCLGSGQSHNIRFYIEQIKNIINPNIEICYGAKEYYPHQAMQLCADITDLINDTGYIPSTPFEIGIKKTIDYCNSVISESRRT